MKKIAVILFTLLVVVSFLSLGTSIAKPPVEKISADSIVTCWEDSSQGNFVVWSRTTPTSINLDECSAIFPNGDQCSPCIRSLETQGCMVVDVVVSHIQDQPDKMTFILSCAKP